MPRSRRARPARDRKVPKTYRLNPAKLEAALDMVMFRDELVAGKRAMLGT